MLETYSEMKARHQKEVNAFPMGFAFSNEQFEKEMERLGVSSPKELLSIGYGGFIRKSDKQAYLDLMNKIHDEEKEFKKQDKNLLDMFVYEMGNHEYQISRDEEEVLNACGIDVDEFCEDERMKKLFIKAKKKFFKLCDENDWWC